MPFLYLPLNLFLELTANFAVWRFVEGIHSGAKRALGCYLSPNLQDFNFDYLTHDKRISTVFFYIYIPSSDSQKALAGRFHIR